MPKKATKATPSKADSEPWLVSGRELARVLGITTQRMSQLKREGFPKAVKRGRYDLPACVKWWVDYWKRRAMAAEAGKPSPPGDSGSANPLLADRPHPEVDQDEARRRKWLAEAQAAELTLEERRGNLVPATEILDTVSPLVTLTRQGFQGFPARMAPRVYQASSLEDVERILGDGVRKALRTIAEAPARALAGQDSDP